MLPNGLYLFREVIDGQQSSLTLAPDFFGDAEFGACRLELLLKLLNGYHAGEDELTLSEQLERGGRQALFAELLLAFVPLHVAEDSAFKLGVLACLVALLLELLNSLLDLLVLGRVADVLLYPLHDFVIL